MSKRKIILTVFLIFLIILIILLNHFNLIPKKSYTAEHFGIKTIQAHSDFDSDGTDDYTDIMLGARQDAKAHPKYISKYYESAYPPENEGVCTDVIWRAFKNAGYDLREMVDKDIKHRKESYPHIQKADKNIDFRRVPNLKIFFDEYAQSLTTDISKIEQFQPGDIVITNGTKHIGIVSDKRNKKGIPYLIHNGGQPNREEDSLKNAKITAHYRFDATKINDNILAKWKN